jgi:hypothetical protein
MTPNYGAMLVLLTESVLPLFHFLQFPAATSNHSLITYVSLAIHYQTGC